MISIVAETINLIARTLHSVLSIASFVGQLIVTLFSTVLNLVVSIFTNIALFFEIIYEDNVLIFTEEIPSFRNHIVGACTKQWSSVQQSISQVYVDCYSSISDTVAAVRWAAGAVCTVLIEVVFLLKRALVFLGDTLWLLLTFLPIQLPLLISHLVKCLKDIVLECVVDFYSKLLKLTNFLTDVPLESFIGIISAIVIVRLCVHFSEHLETQASRLYWFLTRKLMFLYHVTYNYFTDSEVRAIAQLVGHQEVLAAGAGANVIEDNNADPTEALCVVCQERQKCVLILPCRHVCLCRECCMRLYGYQRRCPICRTFIYQSVTIYL